MSEIIQGDCLEEMRKMKENSIDTIITDPPYGIGFMGKEWDTFKRGEKEHKNYEKRNKAKKVDKYLYDASTGKMKHIRWAVPSGGRGAGSYDFSRNKEFQDWFKEIAKEMLRVIKPGGTLLIFGGTRTYHRLACAIEDAGWILRDCIMWLYGSGFPKATDISKQLDKGKGLKRTGIIKKDGSGSGEIRTTSNRERQLDTIYETGEPITEEAKLWNGWKSHGLKPAYEPILVAMKSNEGTYAQNALKWGVSGLNIDGGRIGIEKMKARPSGKTSRAYQSLETTTAGGMGEDKIGRFPANIILDEEAAKILDEQSGESKSVAGIRRNTNQGHEGWSKGTFRSGDLYSGHQDKGGASRFFYVAKASKAERNMGCEGLEEKQTNDGRKDQTSINCPQQREITYRQNHHPTVKPIKLMEYLCLLTKTPTGGVVFDPFAGSGTTGIACKKTGRDFIGIEKEEEYCKIARARIKAQPIPLL